MIKRVFNFFGNPFERIAGLQALAWGMAALLASTVLGYFSAYHYHGLLHFGPAPNPAWWCFAAERVIVWLVPALLFYSGGLLFSRSRIRPVDVLGTTLFAQIPLLFTNFIAFLPFYRQLSQIDPGASMEEQIRVTTELMTQPSFWIGIWFSLLTLVLVILMGYWMFKALAVSCNLKGKVLGILFCVVLIGGDVICRLIINLLY